MHSEIKTYAQYWKRHLNAMEKTRQVLFRKALDDAAQIAGYLRERYGCEEIYLIGSILEEDRFSEKSDIDLVVRGLPKERYFHILAEIRDITDFSIDIIPYEDANKLIIDTVEKEGKQL
ncbi:MAG: nucleotidyltransferase domain-containing protein [Nitrospirae bacterium]|nr:nucleotidyltransferase domain-containing protein [Nitrospirota bacterium]